LLAELSSFFNQKTLRYESNKREREFTLRWIDYINDRLSQLQKPASLEQKMEELQKIREAISGLRNDAMKEKTLLEKVSIDPEQQIDTVYGHVSKALCNAAIQRATQGDLALTQFLSTAFDWLLKNRKNEEVLSILEDLIPIFQQNSNAIGWMACTHLLVGRFSEEIRESWTKVRTNCISEQSREQQLKLLSSFYQEQMSAIREHFQAPVCCSK
jgi:hypothetical protein